MTTKLTPQTAGTTEQLCALDRDNVDSGEWWFLVGEDYIAIGGHFGKGVEIPKKDFDVFVKFYLEEQSDANS